MTLSFPQPDSPDDQPSRHEGRSGEIVPLTDELIAEILYQDSLENGRFLEVNRHPGQKDLSRQWRERLQAAVRQVQPDWLAQNDLRLFIETHAQDSRVGHVLSLEESREKLTESQLKLLETIETLKRMVVKASDRLEKSRLELITQQLQQVGELYQHLERQQTALQKLILAIMNRIDGQFVLPSTGKTLSQTVARF